MTKLLLTLPMSTSSTGETIFKSINEQIFTDEKTKLNFVGIASDDGPNMTGTDQGACYRFKQLYKHIVIMTDISHGLNNVFKKALKCIPTEIQDVLKSIVNHFRRSVQRSALLQQTLIENNIKPLEILKWTDTRFLSIRDSVERILELWPGLEIYFNKYGSDNQKQYFNAKNELYVRIISLLTNIVVDCNQFFQKEDLLYNEVFEQLKHFYVVTANIITKKANRSMIFNEIYKIPFETKNPKEIRSGNYDTKVMETLTSNEEFEKEYLTKYESIKGLLSKVVDTDKDMIITGSIKFLYTCLNQMKQNLPYDHEVLNLSQVLFFEEDYDEMKLLRLKDLFPNILQTKQQKDDFVTEVRKFEYHYNKVRTKLSTTSDKLSPLQLWKNESLAYPNLYLLARAIFVLPYSSIPVERVFSTLKDVLNIKRNRLTSQNLEACLLGCQASKSAEIIIDDEMIEAYTKKKVLRTNSSKKQNSNPKLIQESKESSTSTREQTNVREEFPADENKTILISEQIDDEKILKEDDEDEQVPLNFTLVEYNYSQSNPLKRSVVPKREEGLKKSYIFKM